MRLVVTGLVMILMSGFAWGQEEAINGVPTAAPAAPKPRVAGDEVNQDAKRPGAGTSDKVKKAKYLTNPTTLEDARKDLAKINSEMATTQSKIEVAQAQLDEANQSLFTSAGTKQALEKKVKDLTVDLERIQKDHQAVDAKFDDFERQQRDRLDDTLTTSYNGVIDLKKIVKMQGEFIKTRATKEDLRAFGNRLSNAERDLREMKRVLSSWQSDPCSLIIKCGAKGNQVGASGNAAPAAPHGLKK